MKLDLRTVTRAGILLALALVFQLGGFPQYVTGPVVNTVLLVAAAVVGPVAAVLIGITTPWTALLLGTMKFAPAVPVIIAGNAVLVLVFWFFLRRSMYVGGALAAVVKYLVMTAGIKLLIASAVKVPAPMVLALTTTQLYTALGGAAIAILLLQATPIKAQIKK